MTEKKDDWIRETQMFQRIAKVIEQSYDQLSSVWDNDQKIILMRRKKKGTK